MPVTCKMIPRKKALSLAVEVAKAHGELSVDEQKVMQILIASCPAVTLPDGEFYIREEHLISFISNWEKTVREQDSSFLYQPRGLCVDRIVDVVEFLESPFFMNQKGSVWPSIKNALGDFFENDQYIEAVLAGAIGIGKSYFAEMALAYMVYRLSCYHNPQLEFDLAPGSSMMFIMQSKTLTLAKKVLFEQLTARLQQSPYFSKHFSFDPNVKSELRFPKNIYIMPAGGSETSALGMNVYGGIIDELNFMARVEDSVHTRHTTEAEYDQAAKLYRMIRRRMTSRFMQRDGHVPGRLILVSSANYPGDFTSRKKEEAEKDHTIFVMDYAHWEAQPPEKIDRSQFFLVEVGNELKQSKIIESMEEAKDIEDVLKVPEVYKTMFDANIDEALKDFAGVVTGTRNPFIPFRELIQGAQDSFAALYERSLFKRPELTLDFTEYSQVIDWDDWIVDRDYIEEDLLDPQLSYVAHLDPGLSNNAAGLAVGHLSGYKLLPMSKYWNDRRGEFVEVTDIRAPIYQIDGILRIVSSRGNDVDLEMIRDLLLHIRGLINLKWVTMDSYQAAPIIQALRKTKIRAGMLSVDTNLGPYTELKLAVKDERLLFPPHEIAARELREVEKDSKKDKVDHPAGGCFIGDTRVALLDGTNPTFEELGLRFRPNDIFWVYGFDETGVRASMAHHPRITKYVTDLLEITLDNYSVICCTPDHQFLTLDGNWVEAQELVKSLSLMPLARATSFKGGWADYERIWCPVRKTRITTHQLVGRQIFGDFDKRFILHHRDERKRNNCPSNLVLRDRGRHACFHTTKRHQTDPDWVKKLRCGHEKYRKAGGNEKSRQNMLRLIRDGVIDPRQSARCQKQRNHKILALRRISLEKPVAVWDLSVVETPVFGLSNGIFVHNSKDCSDAMAGCIYILQHREADFRRGPGRRRRTLQNTAPVRKVRVSRSHGKRRVFGRIVT